MKNHDYVHEARKRQARRWLFRTIRTATRRLVPSLPVLVFIAAVAWGLAQIVTVTAIP